MDKQIITFSANEQNLVRIGGEYHYSSNKVSYIGAHFDLGANWDGFDSVRAVWFTDRINGISTVLDGEGNCTVPTEVLKKKDRVFVNLVGSIVSNGELTDRLTTYPAVALVVDSKAKVDSTETAPVTPSQFEQFVSIVQDAVANIKDIVSTTLNADYTLTFVYSDGTSYTTPSIRGERGPQGADGADGTDGNGIASAVLNSNYTLTLTFTDGTSYTTPSIRGAQGPKGDPGDVSQAQLDAAVSDLKSNLGNAIFSVANYNDWQKINVTGDWHSGDLVYIRPISDNLVSYVNISRVVNGGEHAILANQQTLKDYWITLPSDCDAIQIAYKLSTVVSNTKYSAIVKKVSDKSDAFGLAINNMSDTRNINAELAYFDNPIELADKSDVAKNWLKGILGIEIYDTQYEKYCVWYLWHGAKGWDLYVSVRGWSGTEWVALDSIERLTAPSNQPTMEAITSNNGKFRMLIDWNQTPSSVNINSSASLYYAIKDRCIVYTDYADEIVPYIGVGDYELKDSTKHIITVKKDGTGDFTSIASAYASITDSSFLNQYEVVIYEGTYEEYNLICPPYTHTHGLQPDSVIVTSVGATSTLPVFDQKNAPSKLSNMTIISGTGYCVHQDANLNGVVLVNENLYCKKVYDAPVPNFSWQQKTNPAVVGDGAQYNGSKFIWKSCTFEDGEVSCHSNSGSDDDANQHFVLEDCKLVNAWIWLGMAGNTGASRNSHCVAEIKNLYAPKGCPSIKAKYGARVNDEDNWIWQVVGGDNKNFSVIFDTTSDALASELWKNISTTEKAYAQATTAITKGQWITDSFAVCSANEDPHNIMGIALENASSGDTFEVWVGNAYRYNSLANGEYGMGSNGELSATATVKIGKVLNNIFYRY